MTSPDPTATQRALAERLRDALPPGQQHRADEIAALITALPPERADATLRAAYPDLAPLLTPLIRVGDNAQIGDLTIGDLAGRDIVKPTVILAPDDLTAEAQRRRSQILDIVGVRVQQGLDDALTAAAQLELGLTTRPDAVPLAPGLRLQQRAGAQALPAGTTVAQVFDRAGGRLLILGAPGGGKSTLLLQLTAVLLDRARRDPAKPIPALLNLSSWAAEGISLAAWLVTALGETYRIPQKLAAELVQRGRLALLLDGLDEVDPDRRDACVQAINAYQRDHLTTLAVCSRTEEYGRLAGQLQLEQAIELRPLTDEQVAAALSAGGDRLAGLRAAWEHDADLRDLLRTPLLLNVATLAYSDAAPTDTDDPWSRRLFPAFVERALRRRGDAQRYDHAKTLHWLRWLAQTLEAQQLSELYLERMQPGWLAQDAQRTYHRALCIVVGALVGLLPMAVIVFAISLLPAPATMLGLVFAVIVGIGTSMSLSTHPDEIGGIRLGERLHWSWGKLWAIVRSKLVAIPLAVLPGFVFFLIEGWSETAQGMLIALLAFAVLYLMMHLDHGFVAVLPRTEDLVYPGQHLALSLRNGILRTLLNVVWIGLLSAVLVFAVVMSGLIPNPIVSILLVDPFQLFLRSAIAGGFGFGLLFAASDGLSNAVKHYVFRAMLARAGHAPLRYVAFLDYSVALLLLRRVGGGYAFQHRLLRDYIGTLSDADLADLAARAGR